MGCMTPPAFIDGVAFNHLKCQRFPAIEVGTGRNRWTSGQSLGKY